MHYRNGVCLEIIEANAIYFWIPYDLHMNHAKKSYKHWLPFVLHNVKIYILN